MKDDVTQVMQALWHRLKKPDLERSERATIAVNVGNESIRKDRRGIRLQRRGMWKLEATGGATTVGCHRFLTIFVADMKLFLSSLGDGVGNVFGNWAERQKTHASPLVILTGPWRCRRVIRTTGRALRAGRWSAPKRNARQSD
ncbi:uncharacterized protein LOC125500698 isoform X2 [Athalia rosae]|uniref:uncharacterized protein LOC125500698 isoform X2 n=1 Tax=Athalia rosae TaxID=37344 RepID=UPI002033C78D|nr:uncharacterized protein LOC125500698 isoform X2 [Athalia rosae]